MEFGDGGGGGSPRDASDGAPKQAKRKMKTPSQIDVLEKAYAVSSRLSEQMRQELAQKTELSSREISMWFANKRFQGKQAHLPREPKRGDFNPFPIQSSPSGGGSGFVLEACHFRDSNTNEVSIRERSSKLTRPMQTAPQLKMKNQVPQMMPQQQPSHHALDPLVLSFMEKKLGGRLREDGPLVGISFDPLPPGAFESPLCNAELMMTLKQPTRAPKGNSILKQNAGSVKVSSVFQRTDSSCVQSSLWRNPTDEVGSSVNPVSVNSLGSKLPCFPSGKQHRRRKETNPDYALQADAQFTIYPVNDIVDKFVLTDTLANDVTSQMERLHKSDEAQTSDKIETLDSLAACKKRCFKRKSEVQMQTDKEVHDHERYNGESAIYAKQSDEGKLHYIDQQPVCYKKPLNKANVDEEKVRQPEELQLGTTAMEEAVDNTFITHVNIQGNMQLIEDEQLELMKLAASRKGLSSINFLDKDTLDKLHSFRDMLGAFPPASVLMRRPFAISPWTDSDENVGNLLMVWKFLVTFAGDFGLWPFTLEEFAQAFHDQDSRLLGEIHVALLKYIIRDLENVKNARAYVPCINEDNADNSGSTCLNIIDGVHAWGFDIHFWKSKLNFLTWPEILRQLALSAGFGTNLKKKADYAYCHGDKLDVNAGDQVASLDKHHGGSKSVLVQQNDKSSSCDSSYQLTAGTLEFAVFHALSLTESEGLTPVEVANYIQEHRLCNLTTMESAHASVSNILSKDAELFERVGSSTYRVKSCFWKDPSIFEKILTGATKNIRLCRNTHFGKKVSDQNFEDLGLTVRGEDSGDSFYEHPLGAKFTRESLCSLNSTKVSTSLSKPDQNLHADEPGLINESGFKNADGTSLLFIESTEEEIFLRNQNDEFLESIHDISSASGDGKSCEQSSESWIHDLTEGEYSSLSTEERLKVLVALVGVVVEGNSFHNFIEERLKEAQACKKMMLANMRLNKTLQEERCLTDDTAYVHANPLSFSKQTPDLCSYSTLNNVSSQKKNLGQQFFSNSSCILPEPFEHTQALDSSQLELYIDQKAETLHSYRFLPLGLDRRHNKYWQFSTSSRNDLGSGRIFFESKDGFWRVIDSDEAFDAFLAVLDTHGIRESHLYFMLKQVEIIFKDTTRRRKSRKFIAESTTDALQTSIDPDCCTSNHNISNISVLPAYDTLQSSASLKINLINNEDRSSASKKYLSFMKWMWQECFNPQLLRAMRYGTKRCLQLLETCHICYQPYLADERHCASCHLTFGIGTNINEHFSEHVSCCEADFKLQISIPFIPINIQLLKAQLAIIEASIPMEAFHPLWDDSYRKSWGFKLKLSSSAREIFQSLTMLENAIKPDCLCSNFITTNELLCSETEVFGHTDTVSKPVRLIPWIPETTAAVALRLLDLDCSIPYMLQQGLQPLEGTETGEFLVLPRSTVVERAHHAESVISDDTDEHSGGHWFHAEDNNYLHQEPVYDGGQNGCTDMQNRINGEDNSDLEDFTSSGNSDEVEINCELSDSLREDKIPATWAYKTNSVSANMYSKAEVMDDEDESSHRDEFGGGEAVESNECHRWQETVDSYLNIEGYLDEQESEGRQSKIVLERLGDPWDVKDSRWEVAFSTRSADGEENSSSVNTK